MSCVWSPSTHWRFSKSDRRLVEFLLWAQKCSKCMSKDVLITHVIPVVVGELQVPTLYVGGLPIEATVSDLTSHFDYVDACTIFTRQGYGFMRFLSFDHTEKLMCNGKCPVNVLITFDNSCYQLMISYTKSVPRQLPYQKKK